MSGKSYLPLRSFFMLSCVMLLAVAAAGQAPVSKPITQNPIPNQGAPGVTPVINTGPISEDDSYRLGPGDLLDIRVFGRPELGRETRVTNQGRIRLPFLDEIQVACKTENQLAQLITEKYKKFLRDPQVDVFVKEYKSQPVAVIGSVAQPGRFQLQRRVRLLELLTYSGGPNLNSGGAVHIIRGSAPDFCEGNDANPDGGGEQIARTAVSGIVPADQKPAVSSAALNPNAAPTGQSIAPLPGGPDQGVLLSFKLRDVLLGVAEANPYVRPGDIISVPETDQVFVTGSVVKPGPINVRTQITLLQAIGQTGGFIPEAARNRVRVVRQEAGTGIRREYVYNVDDIQRKKAEDIVLLPNDVVDVPASITKNVGRGLLAVGVGMVGYLPYLVFR